MIHQDWEQVILNKKKEYKKKEYKNNNNFNDVCDDDEDIIKKQSFISLSNSKLIQQARCNQNLNQKQLANKLNIDQKLIQMYESGKVIPDIKIMIKLENILKINLNKKTKKN